jgi:hypothetical protein
VGYDSNPHFKAGFNSRTRSRNSATGKFQAFAPSLFEMINQALFINLQFNLLIYLWSSRVFPSSTTLTLNIVFALQNFSNPHSTTEGLPRTKKSLGLFEIFVFSTAYIIYIFHLDPKGPYCEKNYKILNMNHCSP